MVLNLMIKILLILFLSISMSYAKNIHEYNAYYPKSFKPETCLAWHEGEGIFSYGTKVCSIIVVCSGHRNGEYEPYKEHNYDIDVTRVWGKLNGEGSYVQIAPEGLRSATPINSSS